MSNRAPISQIRERTYKARDAWWTVLLVDPVAARLVQWVAPYRWITPNRLTLLAFVIGIGAAGAFWAGTPAWLVVGALLFHLSFVVDCMDGKVARLNGTGSMFGAWLDYIFDRLRVLACTIALFGSQYARTGKLVYLVLAGAVIFLDMFRYLNALMMHRVRASLRKGAKRLAEERLAAAGLDAADNRPGEENDENDPFDANDERAAAVAAASVDLYRPFRDRLSLLSWLRDLLLRNRIRTHLFSGIEFQMAVFIIAPLTGLVIAVTVGASALLIAFEIFLIVKLHAATQVFEREKAANEALGVRPAAVVPTPRMSPERAAAATSPR